MKCFKCTKTVYKPEEKRFEDKRVPWNVLWCLEKGMMSG